MRPYVALAALLVATACESSSTTFVRTPWDAEGTVVVLSLDRSGNAAGEPRIVAAGETLEVERKPGADSVVVLSYPDTVRSVSGKTVVECGVQLADSGDPAVPTDIFRASFDSLESGGAFEPASPVDTPTMYFKVCGEALSCEKLDLQVQNTLPVPSGIELGGVTLSPTGEAYAVGIRGARTSTGTERVLLQIHEDRFEILHSAPVETGYWIATIAWDHGTGGVIGTRSGRDPNFEISQEFVPYRWALDGTFAEYSGLPAITTLRVGKDGTTFGVAEEPGHVYEWTGSEFEHRTDIEREARAVDVDDRDWFAYATSAEVFLWDGRAWEEGPLPVVELGNVGQLVIRREVSMAGANTSLWTRIGRGEWVLIEPAFEGARPRRLRHAGGDRVIAPSNTTQIAIRTEGRWCRAEVPTRSSVQRVEANATRAILMTNPTEANQSVSWVSYAPPD